MKRLILLYLIFFFLFAAKVSALIVPETLDYDLTLANIKIGNVSFETKDAGRYVQLQSKVSAAGWVSLFYAVDDNVVSLLEKRQMKDPRPFAFVPVSAKVEISEGPHKTNKEFLFEQKKKVVLYSDLLSNEKANFVIKDLTFDPLSALYYIRQLPLKVGTSFFVSIFNNKLVYKVNVQVLKKETLKTTIGTVNTVLVRANMDYVGDGIIYYPGDIYLWMTDDDKRTTVMIEKKLKPLIEGKLPGFIKEKMPDFLMEKLSTGVVKAVLIKR